MNSASSILFANEKTKFVLKEKRRIRSWMLSTVQMEKKELGSLCYIFCSDDYLLELNKKFLKHDYYTDILSFDYTVKSAKNKITQPVSGDLLISIDRVRENAKLLKLGFEVELRRVMIHGLLHLLGYADKSSAQKKIMRKKEDEYLVKF